MNVDEPGTAMPRPPGWTRFGRYGCKGQYPWTKRVLDLAMVLLSSPAWLPVAALVAMMVRIRLGSPVLFAQERPGLGGRIFRMLKFRTMSEAKDEGGTLLPDVERLGSFGRRLRSSSMDELPELMGILKGEMSWVGPRPLLPGYLKLYSPEQMRRHDMPPGLTGWAQVNGRNALSWEQKFRLDCWYVDHASLALDIWIMLLTLRRVLLRDGISADGEATMHAFTGSRLAQGDKPSSASA